MTAEKIKIIPAIYKSYPFEMTKMVKREKLKKLKKSEKLTTATETEKGQYIDTTA